MASPVGVSIVVPVYNAERYLRQCLDSIVGQSFGDIEILCVDDGSEDGSHDILRGCADRDPRLKVLRQEKAGAGAARNLGLDRAVGDYLLFCDADDWLDRNMVRDLHHAACAKSADIAVSGVRYFDETRQVDFRERPLPRKVLDRTQPFAPADLGDRLFSSLRIQAWNKLFRREFVRAQSLRFQEQPRVNDLAFVASAVALAERIVAIPGMYYHYRKNQGGNLSSGINEMPEMSARAWLKVRETLSARNRLEVFATPLARAASQSLVDAQVAMTDPVRAAAFFRRVRDELVPALGLSPGTVVPEALPFFSADDPLPILMERLAQERERYRRAREDLLACRGELKIAKRFGPLAGIVGRLGGIRRGGA